MMLCSLRNLRASRASKLTMRRLHRDAQPFASNSYVTRYPCFRTNNQSLVRSMSAASGLYGGQTESMNKRRVTPKVHATEDDSNKAVDVDGEQSGKFMKGEVSLLHFILVCVLVITLLSL